MPRKPQLDAPAKQAIRQRIWTLLEREKVVRFPGAEGRIPNFIGADLAADRVGRLPVWQSAQVIKADPDFPQLPVRVRALREGKTVYMAVPRLRSEQPFIELDPASLQDKLPQAATIKGAFDWGRPVALDEMRPVDLVVIGAVAANRDGARLGRGGGDLDLEYAIARQAGLIAAETPVLTTVYPLQILAEPIPMAGHDIWLDYIVTATETIATGRTHPQPAGIIWEELDADRIASIPVLARWHDS